MPSHYVDRGIIKWSAFDALVGYHSMLEEMKYKLGKKDKPSLSEDALEDLNKNLIHAYKSNEEIELKYYQDGYIKYTYGKIIKIDFYSKLVMLSTLEKFFSDEILEISIQ